MSMPVKPKQFLNALVPMEVTVLGRSMLVKEVHSWNIPSEMLVRPSAKVTLERLPQYLNELVPMEVTPPGIATLFNAVLPRNSPLAMEVVKLG
jgi:hypothetical protein